MDFVFPWALLLLPLPWLVRGLFPEAPPSVAVALRVPFFSLLQHSEGPRQGRRWRIRALLPLLAWACLVTAGAQPRWLGDETLLPTTGRDLLLVIDISGSMRAMDFGTERDPKSRLDIVKEVDG